MFFQNTFYSTTNINISIYHIICHSLLYFVLEHAIIYLFTPIKQFIFYIFIYLWVYKYILILYYNIILMLYKCCYIYSLIVLSFRLNLEAVFLQETCIERYHKLKARELSLFRYS